jgi:DNA-binding CsgD family transcriptional regulator
MGLIEREALLAMLQTELDKVTSGEGHCVFISGEAGIGKTALIKAFCKQQQGRCTIYQGACDALFTPRPLAPLYDIIWQVHSDLWPNSHSIEDRSELFAAFFRKLSQQKERILIVFEDIHWADEATLDFIKFFARRIAQLHCLFILTYRDDEVHSRHPLRNVLGQLPGGAFTRLSIAPLSRQAVEKLAAERGYAGEDVYNITGGNPFYVTEILSSYSLGVPDNIRDAILSAYNRSDAKARQVWDLLSVIPSGIETTYLEQFEPLYAAAIERCLDLKIILIKDGLVFFKHELFRRTIETSLSPLKRVALNKQILDLLQQSFEENQAIERIIHHAKNANEYSLVVKYAPIAARQAASVGAHVEASRLYQTAIEYYQGTDKDLLCRLYEAYADECYLTHQIKEALTYTTKALDCWKEKNDTAMIGSSLRLLSRLWWLDGNYRNAVRFGLQAVGVLDNQPASSIKAMAYSNMSQLCMLSDMRDQCLHWGHKAIAMAEELNDTDVLAHALNNVGCMEMRVPVTTQKGIALLRRSLDIALTNGNHEHVARAYANLGMNWAAFKEFPLAKQVLEDGLSYCEERDLGSWKTILLSCTARIKLETGHWQEAYAIADELLKNDHQPAVIKINALTVTATIMMRKGEAGVLPLLQEAVARALETKAPQRVIPSVIAWLEYEWLTGKISIEKEILDHAKAMAEQSFHHLQNDEFIFWLAKARKSRLPGEVVHHGYNTGSQAKTLQAAAFWEHAGCRYQQALVLYDGSIDDKKEALNMLRDLGADAVYEKMKQEMKTAGIKNIPRGIRRATRSNAAFLTERELDVLQLLKEGMQNKEIATSLFISPKTVDNHLTSILFKLDVNSRTKAIGAAMRLEIIK